jgi:hypothetical protein
MADSAPRRRDLVQGLSLLKGYGDRAFMDVEVRFDDACGNGHNSFGNISDV